MVQECLKAPAAKKSLPLNSTVFSLVEGLGEMLRTVTDGIVEITGSPQ
jgi:hypothetical protein